MTSPASDPGVRSGALRELDPELAYAILRLRSEVFVVEQDCVYNDLDGRDLEPGCRWFWVSDGETVLATLRLLVDDGGARRIGRVVTAPAGRGRGLAARLMRAALAETAGQPVVLDAQSHLEGWYAGFGFTPDGARFLEDGIEHTPMRRPAG